MTKNKYNMLLIRWLLPFFALLVTLSFVPIHGYYVSLTEIRIDTEKKTFNISCKLFTDDLEDALHRLYQKKVDIASSTKNKEANEILTKYMNEHFKVFLDNKHVDYNFIGFEMEDDAVWCYLEVDKYKASKKISIVNSFLYDFLPEQSNVIQLYVDNSIKSEKLINPDMKAEFDLN